MTSQPPPPPPSGTSGTNNQAGADVGVRIGARIIDAILLGIVGAIIGGVLVGIVMSTDGADAPSMTSSLTGAGTGGASLVAGIIGLAVNFAYYIGLDTSMGGTLGKKILNLQIIGSDGGNPSVEESFKRNSWLLLSVIPVVGSILQLAAAIYILVTISKDDANMGWHDRFANTTRVVKT